MAEKKILYRFKGHEKFALREGWLNKGLEAVKSDKKAFSDNFICDNLGVGKNMANSIRYWMKAFKLMTEKAGQGAEVTNLGNYIYENDKYFEDDFTLWILHSNLVCNKEEATSWYTFFNIGYIDEFKKDEIINMIVRELKKDIASNSLEGSIKDDIDVLLNMYCKEKKKDFNPEDKNICPLSSLGLISKKEDFYYRIQPDISRINEWVILYELIKIMGDEKSISIDNLSEGPCSIGYIYNLSRVVINEYLDKLENMKYIKVTRTAGLDSVVKKIDLKADDVILEYYKQR